MPVCCAGPARVLHALSVTRVELGAECDVAGEARKLAREQKMVVGTMHRMRNRLLSMAFEKWQVQSPPRLLP